MTRLIGNVGIPTVARVRLSLHLARAIHRPWTWAPSATTTNHRRRRLNSNPTISVNGTTVFQNGSPTGSASGLTYQRNDSNYVYFSANPGTWNFTVTAS